MTDNQRYPALMLGGLTPIYDIFAKLFFPEKQFRRDLITHARIAPGHDVLDLGAGTGTLAILLKRIQPGAQVTGIDGDARIISIAQNKSALAGVNLVFCIGNSASLPYRSESFDRVLSSLVMSLLSREDKRRSLRETYRVLRGGGECLVADFGPPQTRWGRLLAPLMRRFERISDNLDGLLPALFQEAGFNNIAEMACFSTLLGTLTILRGRKPG